MKNRELYAKDPLGFDLLNNGVSKVAEVGGDADQIKTLRFEMETFVCDGEYAKGLERILNAYLSGLTRPEQQAAWVSGFFGSGKSHLVKMLRYLWQDYTFPDGATARSIVTMPESVRDLFVELTNRAKPYKGLRAVAGTLGASSVESVRIAFLQLIFRAAGLPEHLSAARLVLWLRERKLEDALLAALRKRKLDPAAELRNFYVSMPLMEALVEVDPGFKSPTNAQAAIRAQFPVAYAPSMDDTLAMVRQVFSVEGTLPCVLLVVDEVQQFIGGDLDRAHDVQEIAENCSNKLNSRCLFVGTGQSALTGTASLGRLQARFTVKIPLSDADVETVIRRTVLAKKPEKVSAIEKIVDANSGEISRHLQNTKMGSHGGDRAFYASDYPLLPVRRRFWEKVLRSVDVSGTTAQLRTQLKIVFDAARESAEWEIGSVVPADYIYDQIATDLLNTGILQREIHEIIVGERNGTEDGALRSRLCALIFLIHKLPRTTGADDGVRATEEVLADLLVRDLSKEGQKVRQSLPGLLDELVAKGKLMRVDSEYCLQTREGAGWTHDFNQRRNRILNDEALLGAERDRLITDALHQALKPLSIQHGSSREPRKLDYTLSAARPQQSKETLTLWLRHGWAETGPQVEKDAKAAGMDSPMIFGYLPRQDHENLKQGIAALLAAQETLDAHGVPATEDAIQAANSMRTQLEAARQRVQRCMREVIANAAVYLGGGSEVNGIELVDKVNDAAADALHRLFPRFAEADHANWPQVLNGARGGNIGALQAVGYQGETVRHPVCQAIINFIGSGKKGREVRGQFSAAPYGWPQDAIDAALVLMTLAGNLRAANNGQPVQATAITQNQVGVLSFHVDIPPLGVSQRLDLKALFQKLGVSTPNGQESPTAAIFLGKLCELAGAAGGDAPAPEAPPLKPVRDLQTESGNAQLLAIHQQKETIAGWISEWSRTRDNIAARLPRWHRLQQLLNFADAIPEASSIRTSADAIQTSRALLADPDPVPPLIQTLVTALRNALNSEQAALIEAYSSGMKALEDDALWKKLPPASRQSIFGSLGLNPHAPLSVATEDDVLQALQASSLPNRRTLVEALPQRFRMALEEAARQLEPKAVRVTLPSATIKDGKELESWLQQARSTIESKLKDGPVIV